MHGADSGAALLSMFTFSFFHDGSESGIYFSIFVFQKF
jgi:hypothetical protein